MRVLLASPIGRAGGIARWTGHILDYYAKIKGTDCCDMDFLSMTLDHEQNVISKGMYHRIKRGLIGYYKVIQQENKILKDQKYDLIHIASSASISLLKDIFMIEVAHRHGVKAVVHFRFGRIPELRNQNNWEWKLLCKVVKIADGVIVLDKSSYDTLLEMGFTNIKRLPNPVAPQVVEIATRFAQESREDRSVLFVGHGLRTKGIYELIDACREIPNIKVKMLGAILDSTKDDLYCYANHAEWLEIKGEIPYEDVIREMCKCDIFVLPTYTEGFPNVILEGMACSCAIVTTSVGAIPEMLEEENNKHYGIMVEPQNVEHLKTAIEKMLLDVEFKKECRVNVQQRVNERYNIESVWRQMGAIWREVMMQ